MHDNLNKLFCKHIPFLPLPLPLGHDLQCKTKHLLQELNINILEQESIIKLVSLMIIKIPSEYVPYVDNEPGCTLFVFLLLHFYGGCGVGDGACDMLE